MKVIYYLAVFAILISGSSCDSDMVVTSAINYLEDSVQVKYQVIDGIGFEKGVSRRDPSDIIKSDDTYYIYYTRIDKEKNGFTTPLYPSGYYGTIWCAWSEDGISWTEVGEVLGTGRVGEFDDHAVFTPNIAASDGMFYLYYTAVKTTPGRPAGIFENNSSNDFTSIGVALSDRPEGPFIRSDNNPVISISPDSSDFDSYRVDDAAILKRNNSFWLYYKGRSAIHEQQGPGKTKMGVAFSEYPDGPYIKYTKPVLDRSHEVLIWNFNSGVAALASISSTFEFAADGLDFESTRTANKVIQRPAAPGLFRPHLTRHKITGIPGWGISMKYHEGDIYLEKFVFTGTR